MTNSTQPSSPALTNDIAADDPRAVFARAATTALATIDGIVPTQFDAETPCPDYRVVDLLGHLLAVFGRVAAAATGTGADVIAVSGEPPFAAVSDWPAAFAAAADRVQTVWSDAATLQRSIELPWAHVTGAGLLAMYTNELTVHTWDLTRATGQTPSWDESVLTAALVAIQRDLPADGRIAGFVPFADAVSVPDDAPLIDRFVAWNGRRP